MHYNSEPIPNAKPVPAFLNEPWDAERTQGPALFFFPEEWSILGCT